MECGVSNYYTTTLLNKLVNPGLGNEQSPHYLNMARNFIEANKGTPVGSPGRYQVREPVQHPLHLPTVSWNTLTELILRGSTQAWHYTTWAV